MAMTQPPDEVFALLNRFFGVVVEVVAEAGGSINKFEGDAALAVVGVPRSLEDPAGAALGAARSMHRRLTAECRECSAGIGVAYGTVLAGNLGDKTRFEFTVIGDPVNEASRLCDLAKREDSLVLASGQAVAAADEREARCWEVGEQVTLRGRSVPTPVARPADLP